MRPRFCSGVSESPRFKRIWSRTLRVCSTWAAARSTVPRRTHSAAGVGHVVTADESHASACPSCGVLSVTLRVGFYPAA